MFYEGLRGLLENIIEQTASRRPRNTADRSGRKVLRSLSCGYLIKTITQGLGITQRKKRSSAEVAQPVAWPVWNNCKKKATRCPICSLPTSHVGDTANISHLSFFCLPPWS
ncbi:hypothetical protein ILYODFUR_000263 [Ilyodon furcidens]|uniref:Uncharacterized protein n=1 Tax=Ilyodon furcidens TaxID=33524 RepID=A0ABV0U392_9TELE